MRGASNEYPQHMFLWRNEKNINTSGLKKKHIIESYGWLSKMCPVKTLIAQAELNAEGTFSDVASQCLHERCSGILTHSKQTIYGLVVR